MHVFKPPPVGGLDRVPVFTAATGSTRATLFELDGVTPMPDNVLVADTGGQLPFFACALTTVYVGASGSRTAWAATSDSGNVVPSAASTTLGPLASRPAATGSKATYVATDVNGGTEYLDSATGVWTQIAAGVNGGVVQRLIAGYGSTSGVPNSPAAGVTPGPSGTFGPNLWLSPTVGGGLSTASAPTITANSTNQTIKTRLNVGYIGSANTSGTVSNLGFRLTFDLTSTIASGWGGQLTYQWTDATGTLIAGTVNTVILATGTTPVTNYKGVLDVKAPAAGAVNLEILLTVSNNSTSGTVTLNSMDVRRVGKVRTPLAVGWTAGTPATSGGVFSVFQPLIDPNTQQVSWAETQLTNDSVLEAGIGQAFTFQNGYSTWQFSPLDGTGSAAQFTPSLVRTGASRGGVGAPGGHIKNNSHVMGIINGSSAQELRCNTHGGEIGRSGTYTTDYTFQYDLGDGVWRSCPAILNLAQFCQRFQFTQHTKVTATTGELVANIDYVWTFFDDGTIRQDRTVTFQRTQAMYSWFVWMTSFDPTSFVAQGKMGAGQAIHGGVDYRAKASAPTISGVTQSTGGSLADGSYSYKVTTVTANGESTPSAASTVTVSAGGGTASAVIAWGAATAATGYRIYGRTSNAWTLIGSTTGTSFTDTGTVAGVGAPPTYNTAWTGTGTNDEFSDSQPDWAVYKESNSGVCFSKVINRDDILTQHPSAVGLRGQLVRVGGTICKNYFHLEGTGGGAITGGTQAAGIYPVTIPNGTVVTNTSYDFFYIPADPVRYEAEQTVRATNVAQLATIYPAT